MNIESTDSWTQGLSQHAPLRPQRSQRHWTFLTPRDFWLLKVLFLFVTLRPSQFFPCSFLLLLNPLNIFWNKKTHPLMMKQPCLWTASLPFSRYCPAPPPPPLPVLVRKHILILAPWILFLPVHALFMDTWYKKNKKYIPVWLGEDGGAGDDTKIKIKHGSISSLKKN